MGGAIAAFIFIWWYGTRTAARAATIDEKNRQIADLQEKNSQLLRKMEAETEPKKLDQSAMKTYKVKRTSKQITLFTDSISELKTADIWVSSENTEMQMARFHDRSISGTIRYLGAKKTDDNKVAGDSIAIDLHSVKQSGNYFEPGTVLVTQAGELLRTHGVKKIFHVAAVQGQVGAGFRPIQNIDNCVTNALQRADAADYKNVGYESIALPLFGTGTAEGELQEIVKPLLQRAILYLLNHQNSNIRRIYFLTWLDVEFEACKAVLDGDARVSQVA